MDSAGVERLHGLLAKVTQGTELSCHDCGGIGEVFSHNHWCDNDSCALAGGIDDCDGEVVECHCQISLIVGAVQALPTLLAELATLREQVAGAAAWKSALIDELIVDHIYSAEHETNPRKALHDAISWNVQVALDPAVSQGARVLIATHAPAAQTSEEVVQAGAKGLALFHHPGAVFIDQSEGMPLWFSYLGEADAVLRAALSAMPAAPVQGEEWLPIETAPKDGTAFLACNAQDYDGVETLCVHEWSNPKHRFFNLNSGNFSRHDWWTHWRPLPAPPSSAARAGDANDG